MPKPKLSCLTGTAAALLLAFSDIAGAARAGREPAPAPNPAMQAAAPNQPASAPPPAAAAATATATAPMTGPRIIEVLDQTIDWYRTLGIQQQAANEPRDLLILFDNRQTANQTIGLAFEIARDNAEILAKQPQTKESGDGSGSSQNLAQLQDKFAAQGAAVQKELEADQHQLAQARSKQKVDLQAKISELQGELDLINARKDLLATMSTFANRIDGSGVSASSLKAQIDAMAITLPSAANANPSASNGATPSTAAAAPAPANGTANPASLSALTGVSSSAAARFGLWDLAANVVRLSEKIATIESVDRRTAALQTTFSDIRAPLVTQLKAWSARGDALAAQADTADSDTLNHVRGQLDQLSSEFKQTSALLIPLSKVGVLLNQYRRNLGNWRDAVRTQYHDALKTLGVRLGVLSVLLALVFGAAEVWRRAVMRYVQDVRRRYQFLLLRRIALWILVFVIVGFAFASELGSIVTFAGLITAGLAVAMQSVLVSIVGYFFLIGKYGIRIGDRVQIGEVTGEVIELGLVRLYLMELGAHGSSGPTGRVVAFANSIVFQVSSGLFKQIHGVNFVWREIVLSLPQGIDYAAAKEKLTAAVTHALKDYREEIVRQTQEIQKATASSSGGDAQPRVQLSFSASGVEAHVRYPVHLQNAAEIDERVSQELLQAINALGGGAVTQRPEQGA
jgi:small-conductance mechanosensitive channel